MKKAKSRKEIINILANLYYESIMADPESYAQTEVEIFRDELSRLSDEQLKTVYYKEWGLK
jgi:hypothetical protein